jgi:hypothetical protein
MKEPGLDDRHRDKDGEIQQKAQRYLEQKSFATYSSVFSERHTRHDERKNWEG